MVMDSSKWWWIGNHNTTDFSPWLHSTLSELDKKTKEMLRVIDEDADSFAARAEMYYKKRPELISMVEEFYRSHRSLAERYDLLRPSSVHNKHDSESHEMSSTFDESSWSEVCDEIHEDYAESEVDDGESGEFEMMKEEIERLREENKVYGEMVREKDEEKREVIRQMSLAIQMLKEENLELKKCVVSQRKEQMWKPFGFKKMKLDGFLGRVVGNWVHPKTDSNSRELMTLGKTDKSL